MEDDVVECTTGVEEEREDETSGYTTNTKCSKWPREVCSVSKKPVKKYTPITGCTKEPRELCAPAGCALLHFCTSVASSRVLRSATTKSSLDINGTHYPFPYVKQTIELNIGAWKCGAVHPVYFKPNGAPPEQIYTATYCCSDLNVDIDKRRAQ